MRFQRLVRNLPAVGVQLVCNLQSFLVLWDGSVVIRKVFGGPGAQSAAICNGFGA